VLSLLSRQKLADNEIEVLWRLLNVDRRGAQVLTDLVRGKDAGLVRLIQTHSGLAKADVLAFLDRARVTVDTSVSPPPPPPPPPPPEPGGDEEARARGPYKTVTESLAQADQHLRERCEALRDFLRGLGDDVQEETRKYYFAFKRTQNFACVEIRLRPPALVVYVKVSPESVDLEPGFTRDVRHIGHYGTGDLEITINSDDDLEHAKPLLIRSYESS
jgi:predicted transport protein